MKTINIAILLLLLVSGSLAAKSGTSEYHGGRASDDNVNTNTVDPQEPVGDDLSGIIEEIEVYQNQKQSPIEETPSLQEVQEGITEYGFSFWFKLDYLWKENAQFEFAQNKKISLGYIYESDGNALALALELQQCGTQYCLYLNSYDDENIGSITTFYWEFDKTNFDGQWTFAYLSYSQEQDQQYLGLFTPNNNLELYSMYVYNLQHRDLNTRNKPIFRLANSDDYQEKEGFHGQFRNAKFHYGATGSGVYKDHDALASAFSDLSANGHAVNPKSSTVDLSVSVDQNDNQVDRLSVRGQDVTVRVNNVQYPNQYAVEGYFKVSSVAVLDSEYRLVYKVSTKNTAKAGSLQNLGEITLQAEINASGIKFTTYNIYDFSNIVQTTETIPLTIDQYQNFIYVYQGYSARDKAVRTYIKLYDQASGQYFSHPSSTSEIVHMKSNDYVVTLAKDDHHTQRLRSEFSCFKFRTEDNANQVVSESDIQGLESQTCRQEGFIPNLELNYKLKSYNDETRFLSYGNPTFLTDDRVGRFQLVQGLIGDANTVSLKSLQTVNGELRDQFYWRHDGFTLREMQDEETKQFRKQASFIAHEDKYYPGTIVLESVNRRGFYITIQNYAIVLLQDDGSESFRSRASWYLEEYPEQQLPALALLPIWRLFNSQTGDSILTASDEKVQALQQQGYELFTQQGQSDAIIGYGYNQVRDSHSSALFEFVNPDTNAHYYTTDPNGGPSGYHINSIVAYVYSVNYERTLPVYLFNRNSNPGSGLFHWTTSEQEQANLNSNDFSFVVKKFWVVATADDPCLTDINQCGPAIPEPCDYQYQYREVQEGDCIECDGYINHYEGDVVSRKYTAVCEWCVGGWNQDSEGVRTCKTCDNGYWVDLGDRYQTCYPHCDVANNYYLNTDNLSCQQCPGELIPDVNIQHLHSCQTCEMGTDIELTCEDTNGNLRVVYEPEACGDNETQVRRRQVCTVCEFGGWTRNSDDGQLYCIKVCANPNDYVDENNQCRPCDFGYIYDDGTGTKRCAEHVREGPFTTKQTSENKYSYTVPSDQLDDIRELGFFFWFKGSYLTPNYLNQHLFRTEHARIGGFHLGTVSETRTRDVNNGFREYWQDIYRRDELLHYFPFSVDTRDVVTGGNMDWNGASMSSGRNSNRPQSLYVWNDWPRLYSSTLNGRSRWTVAFWVKIWSGRTDDQSLFSAYSGGNLQLSLNTQSIWYDGSNQYVTDHMANKHNEWHHIAYGRYNTYIDIYVDGTYINDGHYSDSSTLYADEFRLGTGDKTNCDAWFSDLTIYSNGDDRGIGNQHVNNDATWFREGGQDIITQENYQVDTAKTLEAKLNKHNNEDQDYEIINFYGSGGASSSINYPARKDFDNSWNLAYVSQNSDGQAVGYTYFSNSQQESVVEFNSNSDFSEISFYLGQFNGLENTPQCFQGQFYNVELRFGNTGVFYTGASDIQTYLHAQQSGINQLPPVIQYNNLISVFEQDSIIDLSQLTNEQKTFTFDNLEATQEYAVYGWFREHEDFEQSINRALFGLKDQESSSDDTQWRSGFQVGNRAMWAQYSSSSNLEFFTYSHNAAFAGSGNDAITGAQVPFLQKDAKQWFFVYVGYSRHNQRIWTYVKELVHDDDYVNAFEDRDYWHMRPDKQVLSVGYYPSADNNDAVDTYFRGDSYNLRVQYGTVCQPNDFSCFRSKFGNVPTPAPRGQCVILYSQPNYEGDFVSICDKNPDFTLNVQSIYVPEGVKFRLYDTIHFEGLSVLYKQSFDSISSIDFAMLLQDKVAGAEIIKNDRYYNYIEKKENKNFLAVKGDENNNTTTTTSQDENKQQTGGEVEKSNTDNAQKENTDKSSTSTDKNQTIAGGASTDGNKLRKSTKKEHLRMNTLNKRR